MSVAENVRIACSTCVVTNPSAPSGTSDVSPVDGIILRWRIYRGSIPTLTGPDPEYRLRVLSPLGTDYFGAGSSTSSVPTIPGAIETIPTNLPIRAGQLIGLELANEESRIVFGYSKPVTSVFLEPSIADGQIAAPSPLWNDGFIFPFNADILPRPAIQGISPAGGSFEASNAVSISGKNFAEVESVAFGPNRVNFTVDSDSQISAVVPPNTTLTSVPVTVVTAAGSAEAPGGYAYEGCVVPRLKGISLRAVRRTLSRDKCKVGQVRKRHRATVALGRVKRQSPHQGAVLPLGGTVNVTLGRDPAP
jgi:hypothetical protein